MKDAERAANTQDQRFEDDVQLLEVTVDAQTGKIIDGFEEIEEFMAENSLDDDDEFDDDDDESPFDLEDDDEDIIDED